MKNGKQGSHELDRLAAKFAAQRAASLILSPDQANDADQKAFQSEYQTIWALRDQILDAALSGGQPVTIETLDACEVLAKECARRRVSESLKIARVANGTAGPAFRFVAESLGVDVDAELGAKKDAAPATDAPVVNLHG